MSHDPNLHPANPYASPSQGGYQPEGNPLMPPAIILLVLAVLTLGLLVLSLPGQAIRLSNIDTSTPRGMGEMVGGVVTLVVWFALTIAIIIGSIGMIRLKGYSGAMAASIAALVPICTPCFVLGIPFGIWAIVLLVRPEVKARFR